MKTNSYFKANKSPSHEQQEYNHIAESRMIEVAQVLEARVRNAIARNNNRLPTDVQAFLKGISREAYNYTNIYNMGNEAQRFYSDVHDGALKLLRNTLPGIGVQFDNFTLQILRGIDGAAAINSVVHIVTFDVLLKAGHLTRKKN